MFLLKSFAVQGGNPMTARSDELQKGALFAGLAPFFVSEFCHALGIRGKRQSISCVLPDVLKAG
jgi:hypothetical protein